MPTKNTLSACRKSTGSPESATAIALLESQTALDSLFLSQQIVQQSFPDLRGHIQDYYSAHEKEGREVGDDCGNCDY